MMPSLTPTQQLRRLDQLSPQFPSQFTKLIHRKGYRNYVNSLQDDELSWLIEYLDGVLDTLQPNTPAFRTGLHELRSICGSRKLLPRSHVLQASLLKIDEYPIATRGSCNVHEASLNGSRVWVKLLRMYSAEGSRDVKRVFCQEVVVWKRLVHPNIVPLLGATVSPFQSVSVWISGAELQEYISAHPHADRLILLSHVANGLGYLHSRDVVHGDLKGSSILVDNSGRARLTDFGFSRIALPPGSSASMTEGHAVRWAAPEILDMECPVSKASDIYSFAMVVIETFTGRVPFHESLVITVVVDILSGCRPERPADPGLTDDLWNLTEQCWNHNPQRRPRISEVVVRLRAAFASRSGDCVLPDGTMLRSSQEPPFEWSNFCPTGLASHRRWRFWRFGGPRSLLANRATYNDQLGEKATPTGVRCGPSRSRVSNLSQKIGRWFSRCKSHFDRNSCNRHNRSLGKQEGLLADDRMSSNLIHAEKCPLPFKKFLI